MGAKTFGIGRMEADFHCCGTVELKMERLNRQVRLVLVESVADRTKTHVVVDNNIQASSKVIFCSIQHTPPTVYRMGHRTNCRRRTTNTAVTVTVSKIGELLKAETGLKDGLGQ